MSDETSEADAVAALPRQLEFERAMWDGPSPRGFVGDRLSLRHRLSDVDRNVYEQLELRAAQHPSEANRSLLTRVLAFCLSYEEGIALHVASRVRTSRRSG